MDKSAIVPGIVDDFGTATDLHVEYASQTAPLEFGQLLSPAQVAIEPKVSWSADPAAFHTLLMTDPDAPARCCPFLGEVRHWLVMNIPGDRVADGETIATYIPSGPPPLTGLHRYVFLVFRQPNGRVECTEPRVTARVSRHRLRTSTRALIGKYALGQPIAANLFLARH